MADKELKDIEQVAQRVSDAHGFLHIDDKTAQLTALDAQIDCARVILDTVLRAGETDTHASLYAVNETEHRTTLVFLQLYSALPRPERTASSCRRSRRRRAPRRASAA